MEAVWKRSLIRSKLPSKKATDFYFESTTNKLLRGRSRTTIATTLQNALKKTLEENPTFSNKSLKKQNDLERIRDLSENRKLWKTLTENICKDAE